MCFFKRVGDRTANTLISVIKENILPGSIFIQTAGKLTVR